MILSIVHIELILSNEFGCGNDTFSKLGKSKILCVIMNVFFKNDYTKYILPMNFVFDHHLKYILINHLNSKFRLITIFLIIVYKYFIKYL